MSAEIVPIKPPVRRSAAAEMYKHEKQWWACLRKDSPRYREWICAIGPEWSGNIPLTSPFPKREKIGPSEDDVYHLSWRDLTAEQRSRLTWLLVWKTQKPYDQVSYDIDAKGTLAIRAEDVRVFFDSRAFL